VKENEMDMTRSTDGEKRNAWYSRKVVRKKATRRTKRYMGG
jgi:hypothetical protein